MVLFQSGLFNEDRRIQALAKRCFSFWNLRRCETGSCRWCFQRNYVRRGRLPRRHGGLRLRFFPRLWRGSRSRAWCLSRFRRRLWRYSRRGGRCARRRGGAGRGRGCRRGLRLRSRSDARLLDGLNIFARFEEQFLFLVFGHLAAKRWRGGGDRGQEDQSKNKPSPHFHAHAKQMACLVQVARAIEVQAGTT